MALVEARLGNSQEAEKFLAMASSLDAENPIVFCTDYLIKKSDKSIAGKIALRYENFPDELLEVVVTFYGAGFMEEAFQTLNLVQKTNSMVELYRAELESLTGKKSRDTGNPSVTTEFAWRLEEYFILKRKIKQNPEDAGSYYCLGNFKYAHDFEMDGIDYWKKAHQLGYNDKVMSHFPLSGH